MVLMVWSVMFKGLAEMEDSVEMEIFFVEDSSLRFIADRRRSSTNSSFFMGINL